MDMSTMSKENIERLSARATISRHRKVLAIDQELIRTKVREASSNVRKREVLILHRGDDDALQRMVNAIEPSSYIRPHRHRTPPRPEPLALLSGSAGFVTFHDDGTLDTDNFVLLEREKGAVAVDCRESVWHTFIALEPGTVLFEVKPGPFDDRTDKEFAPWAPTENAQEAPEYLEWLKTAFWAAVGGKATDG
jgi:cupin fold WbuC family metalloprotein